MQYAICIDNRYFILKFFMGSENIYRGFIHAFKFFADKRLDASEVLKQLFSNRVSDF